MNKKSLFGRIAESLKEDEGPTAADIDREVESAVEAVKAQKLSTVSGDSVLRAGAERDGSEERVYLMDLAPLYAIIGGRNGRVAESLREECGRVFGIRRLGPQDSGAHERDLFVMRFPGATPVKGFLRAAMVVNEVGKAILGDRFESMDVEGLLAVAREEDLRNADGSFNHDAARVAVDSGGLPVSMAEPPESAPQWIKLRWKSQQQRSDLIAMSAPKPQATKTKAQRDREHWLKRERDRRKRQKPITIPDRRRSFDRRGRGY